MSEELEKAAWRFVAPLIEKYGGTRSNDDCIRAFKAGAEWQRDKTAREVMKKIDELIKKMRKKEAKDEKDNV